MRKQIINRLGAAHIRDTLKQFVAGEINRFQAMDSLRIGKSQLCVTLNSAVEDFSIAA